MSTFINQIRELSKAWRDERMRRGFCRVCGEPIIRGKGEHPSNFKRRRVCRKPKDCWKKASTSSAV